MPKMCFSNAQSISLALNDVEYVEGEIILSVGIAIAHAWNCVNGVHVDLTFEFNDPEGLQFPHYTVVQGTVKQLQAQGYQLDSPKDLFTQWLNRPEQKRSFPLFPFRNIRTTDDSVKPEEKQNGTY